MRAVVIVELLRDRTFESRQCVKFADVGISEWFIKSQMYNPSVFSQLIPRGQRLVFSIIGEGDGEAASK